MDLRTITLGVPPQEVSQEPGGGPRFSAGACAGADEGQRDGLRGRGGLLQSQQRHHQRGQRGGRPLQHQVSRELVCKEHIINISIPLCSSL